VGEPYGAEITQSISHSFLDLRVHIRAITGEGILPKPHKYETAVYFMEYDLFGVMFASKDILAKPCVIK